MTDYTEKLNKYRKMFKNQMEIEKGINQIKSGK